MEMTAACKAKQQPHIEKKEKNITEVRAQRRVNSQPSAMKKGEKKEKGKRNTAAVRISRKDDV